MSKAYSISDTCITVGGAGRKVDLQKLFRIDGYRLEISIFSDNDDPDMPLRIDATYFSPSGEVEADMELERFFTEEETPYLDIDKLRVTNSQEKLGTKIFAKVLELSEAMEVEQLSVSASEVGSYYWARMGFIPTENKWPELRKIIVKRLAEYHGLNDYDVPTRLELSQFAKDNPAELLIDINWFGVMDLTNARQMELCRDYISSKMGRAI